MPPTFAELYCSQHHLAPGDFNRVVFLRSLYPPARLISRLVEALSHDFFEPDRSLVSAVGALRRARDFSGEISEFVHHPANRRFARRTLRMRISAGRLRLIFKTTLAAAGVDVSISEGTAQPFETMPKAEESTTPTGSPTPGEGESHR